MLDHLDQIDWSGLSHAYGEASDVPDLLRDLASPDDALRQKALYALYGNIWHQGTVYEATGQAVPFLIELLTIPSVTNKSGILHLLQCIAGGSSYRNVYMELRSYRSERQTKEFQARRTRELDWVHDAHRAVVEGTPIYLILLSDAKAEVRTMAAYVLASCPERHAEIEPMLRLCSTDEKDPVAKVSLLLAWAHLGRLSNPASVLREMTIIHQNVAEVPPMRFVAALGAILLGGETVLDESLRVLRETVASCGNAISKLPWELGETTVSAASAMLALFVQERVGWLLEMLEQQDPENRIAAIEELEELCRERRSVPQAVVVPLVRMMADSDPRVRKRAARVLPILGKERQTAIPFLMALQNHHDGAVSRLAEETLTKVRAERNEYTLEKWLRPPKKERTVEECIVVLEGNGRSSDCAEAATTLEFLGRSAQEAVPALRHCLDHDSHWVRVRAARALWKITGNPSELLPILQEEIQCRPAGLLVLDCLGNMGSAAKTDLPTLQHIVDSELRLVEIGSLTDWIDEDEAFREAARHAIERIEFAVEWENSWGFE